MTEAVRKKVIDNDLTINLLKSDICSEKEMRKRIEKRTGELKASQEQLQHKQKIQTSKILQ